MSYTNNSIGWFYLLKYMKKVYLYILGAFVGAANGLFGSGGGIVAVPMLEL